MAVILNQGVVSGIILVNLISGLHSYLQKKLFLFFPRPELFAKIELNCMYL